MTKSGEGVRESSAESGLRHEVAADGTELKDNEEGSSRAVAENCNGCLEDKVAVARRRDANTDW